MQILYRYIFRRAAVATILVVTTCCVIASLINLFDILDDVVKHNVTVDRLMLYLLVNLGPRMMELLSVMMILAGLFTMGELNRRLELVSMRAAGFSDGMLMRPIVWLGGLVFAAVVTAQMNALPSLHRRGDEMKSYLKSGRDAEPLSAPFYVQLGNVSLQASAFDPAKEELSSARMVVLESGRVAEIYQGGRLAKGPAGWEFTGGFFRKLDPPTGQVIKYEPFERMPYPAQFPVPPDFLFEAIHRRDQVTWMPFRKLVEERSFVARQEIHIRIAMSLSTAISLFVGAWFGMKMQRFNAARAICLAILIGFAHRLVLDGFLAFGVETGASWTCHLANLLLAATVLLAPFLTVS